MLEIRFSCVLHFTEFLPHWLLELLFPVKRLGHSRIKKAAP